MILSSTNLCTQVSALEQERSSLTAQLQREQTRVQELHAQHESVMDKSQKLQRELRQAQQSLLQVREQTRVQELHAQHESVMDKSQKLQRELRQAQQSLLQVIFSAQLRIQPTLPHSC